MVGRLTRIKAYKASKGHCVYCGKHIRLDYVKGRHDHMELDHVVAKAKGGTSIGNRVAACEFCNSRKSSDSIEEFRSHIEKDVIDEKPKALLHYYKGPVIFYYESHQSLIKV